MQDLGKIFLFIGVLFLLIGILWTFGGKYFSFGKLPGDLSYEGKNVQVYFPLATSIVLSILLSIILYFFYR